jgi:hypothetical protein
MLDMIVRMAVFWDVRKNKGKSVVKYGRIWGRCGRLRGLQAFRFFCEVDRLPALLDFEISIFA